MLNTKSRNPLASEDSLYIVSLPTRISERLRTRIIDIEAVKRPLLDPAWLGLAQPASWSSGCVDFGRAF